MEANIIYNIDCLTGLRNLPDDSIDCCVTSPPYFNLRDYGVSGQIGLEDTPEQYIQKLVGVFHEVRRVLAPAGTLWVNIGDCYAGSGKGAANYPDNAMKYKQGTNRGTVGRSAIVKKFDGYKSKDLIGIPWMLAFALRADGWFLRQDIIWAKPNPMPESMKDRCTKSHEYIFLPNPQEVQSIAHVLRSSLVWIKCLRTSFRQNRAKWLSLSNRTTAPQW